MWMLWKLGRIDGDSVLRRRCKGLGGRLERRKVKICVFHAKELIYNLQISLSELVSSR